MKTRIIKISSRNPDERSIAAAATVIKNGGLVVFPTETVYGLGANALDKQAVQKIFTAKKRPADNPLIVHIASYADLIKLAYPLPSYAQKLIRKFWPGPLTLVLRKKRLVPDVVTAGGPTIAVRMPKHKVALALIKKAGVPIAAPSANLAGRPSGTSASDVLEDLDDKIDLILDGGPTRIGLESTVLDVTQSKPIILRLGGITKETLEDFLGMTLFYDNNLKGLARSPGMKYRHYAPRAKVIIVSYDKSTVMTAELRKLARHFHHRDQRIGILATLEKKRQYPKSEAFLFAGSTSTRIGKNLFRYLRLLDSRKLDVILVEGVPEHGLGAAIMNRLRKAAGN